jgi:predicted nucleic acid-binding protein
MSGDVVVDASVAFKWFVREPLTPEARRLLAPSFNLIVPDLLWPELGSALWKRVRRQQMTPAEAQDTLRDIRRVPMETRAMETLMPRALEIATVASRSVYDCIYLSLAELEGVPFVTADRPFHTAIAQTSFARHMLWVEKL